MKEETQKNIGYLKPIINMADKVICQCVCGRKVEVPKDPKQRTQVSCGCIKKTETQLLKAFHSLEKTLTKFLEKE